jgi:hypothetical protein
MQWIEAIINISAFAGFIGVANLKHHQTRCENPPSADSRGPEQCLPK